jgi:hypothetical protein
MLLQMGRIVTALVLVGLYSPAWAAWPADPVERPYAVDQLANIINRAKAAAAAKQDANFAIGQARQRFFEDRMKGADIRSSLDELERQLFAKDIYYLTPYLFEGMTPKAVAQFDGVEKLTGGPLDGGLIGELPGGLYSQWVDAIRTALHAPPPGTLWLPYPADTGDAFERYRLHRDQEELNRWRKSHGVRLPAATTPEALADNYAQYVLDPEIKLVLARLPVSDRDDAAEELKEWRQNIRAAIIDYEKVSVTRATGEQYLRSNNFSSTLVAAYLDMTLEADELDEKDRAVAVATAVTKTIQMRNIQNGTRTAPLGSIQVVESTLKDYASSEPSNRLDYLYKDGQPVKFPRDRYGTVRERFQKGYWFIYPD